MTHKASRWNFFWSAMARVFCLPFFLLFISPGASSSTLPDGFRETTFTGLGFDPTAMAFAPDGRLFVTDKNAGAVRVIKNGVLLTTPFLTVAVAPPNPNTHGYEGLVGVAVDPNFPANPYVYVHYTVPVTELGRVSRFTVSAGNPDVADSNSEFVLLDGLPSIHGDHIHFGTDDKLYVAIGGEHNAGREQNLDSYEGKLLRLSADGSIPGDNPVFGDPGALPGIWAYGLRNPFTFAVDPASGELFINDVGNNSWEEINLGVPGGNYGWPSCEGSCAAGFENPLYQYPHNLGACAITGGTFYRGTTFPSQYAGSYFFLDFCANWIRYLDTDNTVRDFASDTPGSAIDMTVGPDGSLYYLSRAIQAVQKIEWIGPPVAVYEAEQLTLAQGNVASTNCACAGPSAGQCARNQASVGSPASASTTYTGPSGVYQFDIRYCDENDDAGAPDEYTLTINGIEHVSWASSDGPSGGQTWRIESSIPATLFTGDEFSIVSVRGSSASWARLDKIELFGSATNCGNGTIDPGEVCEVGDSRSCVDGSGYAGSQDCNASCTGFGACVSNEFCGDGVVQAGAGEICDDGALNGTVGFCNTGCDGITGDAPTVIEAETMTLVNGNVASSNCACSAPSAGQCARNQAAVGAQATASTQYSGPGGVYQVDVTYCDEDDDGGTPDSYALNLNGVEQLAWTSSNGVGAGQIWQVASATLPLAQDDVLSVVSRRGSSVSWARVDKVELLETDTQCGNGVLDPGEACELGDNRACVDGAGYAGTQDCNASCTGFAACLSDEFCGDGIVQSGAGEICDDGTLNGTAGFCNAQCDGMTGEVPSVVEAEAMTLSGGNVVSTNCACASPSAGQCARNQASVGTEASASTTHQGAAGVYRVEIAYCDEDDDNGAPDRYRLNLNGVEQEAWTSDGAGAGQAWRAHSVTVALAPNDALSVLSTRGSSASWARLDKVDLVKLSTSCGNGIVDPGESCDDGDLNGTVGFCNLQCNGITLPPPTFIEAETMTLSGGNVASSSCACSNPSGGQCARNQASVGSQATASATHSGDGGSYRVEVTYCDESDDNGAPDSYVLHVNGVPRSTWTSSNGVGPGQTWRSQSVTLTLARDDVLTVISTRGGRQTWARLDTVALFPLAP